MNKRKLITLATITVLTLTACSNLDGEEKLVEAGAGTQTKVVESAEKEFNGTEDTTRAEPERMINDNDRKENKTIRSTTEESQQGVNAERMSENFVGDTDQRDDRTAGYTDSLPENDELTKEMLDRLSGFKVSLVEPDKEPTQINKDRLIVIRNADGSEYNGWVVRYGKNKIGLLVKYKETTGSSAILFGDKEVSSKIKNDEFGEFLKFSEEVIKNNAQ